jgi:hypothetical protein
MQMRRGLLTQGFRVLAVLVIAAAQTAPAYSQARGSVAGSGEKRHC